MPATTATTAAAASSASRPWDDLPPELLVDIAGRLHAASDTVRFHAVCWLWRALLAYDGYTRPRPLPWLLAPSTAADDEAEDQRCRCVFSKETYRAPGMCVRDRRVAYLAGEAAWVVRGNKRISLVDPLTADTLDFPGGECMTDEWLDHRHRIVNRFGVVLLYDFDANRPPQGPYLPGRRFRASFLRHGHREWKSVSSDLSTDRCCAAAYYGGGYVVCVDLANCHVLWKGWEPILQGRYYLERTKEVRAALPEEPGKVRLSSYLVEHDGRRLLLASVLQEVGGTGDRPLSVSLHDLHLKAGQDGLEEPEVEWVRRDHESDNGMMRLGDHILLLGFPSSFAAVATLFGGEVKGGTAYFVIEDNSGGGGQGCSGTLNKAEPSCSVYSYSFQDGVATMVETLPAGWDDARCMWFLPYHEIWAAFIDPRDDDEGSQQAASSGDLQGCGNGGDRLRIYAGGLSPQVDTSRLREMFSVYGKVARTRVAYDKRGRSRRFGFVTMATQQGFDKAMAALNAVDDQPAPVTTTIFDSIVAVLILLLILALFYLAVRGLIRAAWLWFF